MYGKFFMVLLLLTSTALFLGGVTKNSTNARTPAVSRGFTNGYSDTLSSTDIVVDTATTTQPYATWRETPRGVVYDSQVLSTSTRDTKTATESIESLFAKLVPRARDTTTPPPSTPDILWNGSLTGTPSVPRTDVPRTPRQEALYTYGNDIGGIIRSFEIAQSGQVDDLGRFFSEEGSAHRIARLSNAYRALANDLSKVVAPASARHIHSKLVRAYDELGVTLENMATADKRMTVSDATTYNEAAMAVGKQLIALIELFAAEDVNFSPSDPGSIFSLPAFPSR